MSAGIPGAQGRRNLDRTMDPQIPFIDLAAQQSRLGTSISEAISAVLSHGQYVNGPEVHQLEEALAARVGQGSVVTCSSGTDALVLALLALGVVPGDAVLVPAFTFAASAGAVSLLGAVPVFVDVDGGSCNITAEGVEAALSWCAREGVRPKVVIAVDLYGHPADASAITAVAARAGAALVADAAQSFGASRDGIPVGALAPLTALSFFPSKPLGCYGDGGAVLSLNTRLDDLLRSLREHGRGADRYEHLRVGINGRLDSIQAAVLLQKLMVFDDELTLRRAIAERYEQALSSVVGCPRVDPTCTPAWAQYTIQVDHRDQVVAALAERGVPTAIHYPRPLHRQPAFDRCPVAGGSAPVAERLAGRVLSLPMHPYLEPESQDRVTAALLEAVG